MTPREQAEKLTEDNYCGIVCWCTLTSSNRYACNDYKREIKKCLQEWAAEDKAEDVKEANGKEA